MKFLFLFCSDQAIDPVASAVLNLTKQYYNTTPCYFDIDDKPVHMAQIADHQFYFAETHDFACNIYPKIASEINRQFFDVNMIGFVNWHAGASAPAKIFCAHSTADVPSGTFGLTSGEILAAILMAIEEERKALQLSDFRTLFEASHWSGSMNGRPVEELKEVKAPVFDIEIGSFPEDWNHSQALEVLTRALGKIPDFCGLQRLRAIFLGGIHFEQSATEMVFQHIVIEHHLPNHWLVSGGYDQPGAEAKIIEAAKSCLQPPEIIVFHAGLKSGYKECARKAAALLGIPCVSHKQLRTPDWKQTILVQT